jgi:adenylate kinase
MDFLETRPLVIIFMGPPGAGKGTHANLLSSQIGLPHISTGDLFRENIRNETVLGNKAKGFMDLGKLVPDELVLSMLYERVAQGDCREGYILDGVPRTLQQAESLEKKLKDHQVIALNFRITDETIVQRISGRIACKECGRPYHRDFDPPKNQGICDSCSGTLYQRDDDREEMIRKRLSVYRAQTMPLIAYYTPKGLLREIDSEQNKNQVFQDVLEALPPLLKT